MSNEVRKVGNTFLEKRRRKKRTSTLADRKAGKQLRCGLLAVLRPGVLDAFRLDLFGLLRAQQLHAGNPRHIGALRPGPCSVRVTQMLQPALFILRAALGLIRAVDPHVALGLLGA